MGHVLVSGPPITHYLARALVFEFLAITLSENLVGDTPAQERVLR
jgi:hypothetical protein